MRNEGGYARWISTSVGFGLAALGAVYVGRAIVREWDGIAPTVAAADGRWLALAFVLGTLGMTTIGLAWREALSLAGIQVSRRRALGWYFLGQLGKYLPGGIWPVVGRGELAVRGGAPRGRAYSAVLLSIGATYLAGMLFVAGLLPFEFQVVGAAGGVVWLLLLAPVGVVLLGPPVQTWLLGLVGRATGVRVDLEPLPWTASMRLVAAHLPAWAALGGATWCVAVALHGSASIVNLVAAAVLAWVVGFLAIPVPGGLGVREAVFTLAATSLGTGPAAAVAVAARVLFMLVDAAGAALALIGVSRGGSGAAPLTGRSTSSGVGSPSAPPEGS